MLNALTENHFPSSTRNLSMLIQIEQDMKRNILSQFLDQLCVFFHRESQENTDFAIAT